MLCAFLLLLLRIQKTMCFINENQSKIESKIWRKHGRKIDADNESEIESYLGSKV